MNNKYLHIFSILTESANKVTSISFPKSEYRDLKHRLDNNQTIGTTRISSEKGKYHKGDILNSPFGKLIVIDVVTKNHIKEHPHYNELTPDWIKAIGNNSFDYITLKRMI